MGGQAHNDTVTYIYETLTALGDYYDVTLQPWSSVVQVSGEASLAIDGTNITEASLMEYSASGDVSAPLVPVSNFGCDQVCIDPCPTSTFLSSGWNGGRFKKVKIQKK